MNLREAKYSVPSAAQLLQVSPVTIRREINRGNLGTYRMAGRLILGERHLLDYITRREQKPRIAE